MVRVAGPTRCTTCEGTARPTRQSSFCVTTRKVNLRMPQLYLIERDGFVGVIIGEYVTLEGEQGVVLQQAGTKVVHVYRRKWLVPIEEKA